MSKPNYSEIETYLIKKFMGDHGGLTPRNIEFELEDGYEFAIRRFFGGTKEGLTITKKKHD